MFHNSHKQVLSLIKDTKGVGNIYTCNCRIDISLTLKAGLSKQVHFSPFFILPLHQFRWNGCTELIFLTPVLANKMKLFVNSTTRNAPYVTRGLIRFSNCIGLSYCRYLVRLITKQEDILARKIKFYSCFDITKIHTLLHIEDTIPDKTIEGQFSYILFEHSIKYNIISTRIHLKNRNICYQSACLT